MADINNLMQEFWTSSDGAGGPGASFFAIRRLFEILHESFNMLEVCFDIIPVFTISLIKSTDVGKPHCQFLALFCLFHPVGT